jgi:hypothetical protein
MQVQGLWSEQNKGYKSKGRPGGAASNLMGWQESGQSISTADGHVKLLPTTSYLQPVMW